jgi:hypothetical protein
MNRTTPNERKVTKTKTIQEENSLFSKKNESTASHIPQKHQPLTHKREVASIEQKRLP